MKRFCGLLSLALGLALSFLMSSSAMAQCAWTATSGGGVLEVDVNAPLNSRIAQADVVFSGPTTCGVSAPTHFFSTQPFYGAVATYGNVYRTNIAGIGVATNVIANRPAGCQGTPYLPFQCDGSGGLPAGRGMTLRFTFIRIGTISAASQSLTGSMAAWNHGGAGSTNPRLNFTWGSAVTISPRRPTCSVAVGDRTVGVNLGDVAASAFTGVGSTAGGQNFNLAVTCTGGDPGALARTVNVRATDATRPTNTSQVLSLTTASTATGVGVQMRRGATVLTYGATTGTATDANQWTAGSVGTGVSGLTIPLSARYVQTAAPVTAGTANAQAIFTMVFN